MTCFDHVQDKRIDAVTGREFVFPSVITPGCFGRVEGVSDGDW